jgi:hypothetical protein
LLLLRLLLPPGRRETMGWGGGSLPRRATVANLARSPTGMMDRFQVGGMFEIIQYIASYASFNARPMGIGMQKDRICTFAYGVQGS